MPLVKTEGEGGGYSLASEEPAVLTDVPLHSDVAVIVSLQMAVDSTSMLIGWLTACPCDGGGAAPAATKYVGPLSRGPQPAPDGCLALSWGDLEVDEEVKNNNIDASWQLNAELTPAAPAAEAAAPAAVEAADPALQATIVQQQAQIAALQKKLAAEESKAAPTAAGPTADASAEATPAPAEDALPKTERSSSIGGAPWQQDEFQQARQDVDRLAAELRAKEESEAELQKQLISSEAAKEQLAHDYQEQERSLKIAEAISAGIPKQIAKATEPSTAEELRAQMLQIVDAELGSLEVSPAEPVPRRARAELYNAGVPEIVDGEDVASGDKRGIGQPIDLALEESDTLQDNELVFQCMGFTPTSDWTSKNVYFVLQFYHFAPAVTETVSVQPIGDGDDDSSDVTHVFVKQSAGEEGEDAEKGVKVSFLVKGGAVRGESAIAESRRLASYLCTGAMHMEVWDADTLLPLGSLKAQMSALLRQGQPSVEETMQLDIFSERLPGGGGGTVTGTLQLGVANIGRMAMDAAAELGKRVREDDNITTGHMVSGVVRNATAEGRMRYRSRATPFSSAADGSAESAEASAARVVSDDERKTTRLHKLAAARAEAGKENGSAVDIERVEQLQQMDVDRARTRQARISKSLQESLTRTLRLQTRFGEATFFEYVFQNPFSTNLNVTLDFDDEELSIVTDVDEWAHFKRQHGLTSPLERNFMEEGGREIYLSARETVYIPFTLRSNHCGRVSPPVEGDVVNSLPEGVPGLGEPAAAAAAQRQFTVTVRGPQQVVSVLKLDVVPQPFVVDARIHYHAAQEEQLATRIPVAPHMCPAWRAAAQPAAGSSWHVHCTEPNAVVEITKSGLQTSGSGVARPGPDVHLRYKPGTAPSVSVFYIVLYRDRMRSVPAGVWQVVVHALDMQELRAAMGQSNAGSLVLRGPAEGGKREGLRCCSSQPSVLKVLPVRITRASHRLSTRCSVLNWVARSSVAGGRGALARARAAKPNRRLAATDDHGQHLLARVDGRPAG